MKTFKRRIKLLCALVAALCLFAALGCTAFAYDGVTGEDYDTYPASGTDIYDPDQMYAFEDEYADEMQDMAQTVGGINVRTRVLAILEDNVEQVDCGGYFLESHVQILLVDVLSGEFKGQQATVEYDLSDAWGGGNEPDPAKKGDMVIAQLHVAEDGSLTGIVTQYGRQGAMLWLGIIFLVLLTFFGGKRGLRSVIALLVICAGLIFIMIPAMLDGFSPVWAAILASLFAVTVTLTIVYGFTMKTLAAAIGAIGGIIVGGIIVAIMNATMNMTGLVDDESMYLAQWAGTGTIDLRGILFAAIMISVLGGTIDVSISIASALDELRQQAKDITGAEMMKSGINIGVDIMGASLNTLILSYVGGSIHLLMLFTSYNSPMLMIINDEMIACEIIRALAGSFGLLLTVPITSLVAAILMCGGNFGRLTPDCFASYVAARKLFVRVKEGFGKLSGGLQRSKKDTAQAALPEEEQPENLFEVARTHFDDLERENSDSDAQ